MKTKQIIMKIIYIILFFTMGWGNVFGQVTYTGTPSTASNAVCSAGSVTSNCGTFEGNTIKAYISISGTSATIYLIKCSGKFGTGTTGKAGTYYLKTDDVCGTVIASNDVANGANSVPITISLSHVGTKNYRITFTSSNGIKYYTNNISITGTQTPMSDLQVWDLGISPANINPGGSMNIQARIRNTGNAASASSKLGYYLSNDNVLSPQDQLLDEVIVPSVPANSYSNFINKSITIPTSTSSGTKYIILKADYNNAISESNENNNTESIHFTVLQEVPPSLLVESCFNTSSSTYSPGQQLTGYVAVRNSPSTQTWSGTIIVFLKAAIGTATYTVLSQSYTITGGNSQTINFNYNLNIPTGNYKLYCQYTNAPNGGTAYINNEGYCTSNETISGTNTPTKIISIQQATCWSGTPATGEVQTATEFLCGRGIIQSGQSATTNSQQAILRQDLAKISYLGLYKQNSSTPEPNSPALNFPTPFLDMQGYNTGNEYWYNAAKVLAYLQYNNDQVTPFDRDFLIFNPEGSIKRRYAVKLFLEAFNIAPSTSTTGQFSDVALGSEMYGYIKKAKELGIVSGNAFRPDDDLTREESFVLLYRILTSSSISKPTIAQLENKDNYFVPGNYRIGTFGNVPDLGQGNFNHYQKTSFSIGGRSTIPLDFTHTYNSYLTELPKGYFEDGVSLPKQSFTPLGIGWTHSYNIYAVRTNGYTVGSYTEPTRIMFYYPDGSISTFKYSNGNYVAEGIGNYDTFTLNAISGGERITITTKNKIKYVFENFNNNNHFFCKEIKDRNNNGVKLSWSPTSNVASVAKYKLTKVQEEANNGSVGRSLTFSYPSTTSLYISSVKDNALNRTIYFNVNSTTKNLLSYTDPKGQTSNYTYDVEGYNTSNLLKEIQLPKGNKIRNIYEQRKLKSSQTFASNGVVSSETNVNWTPEYSSGSTYNSSSTVTDPENRQTSYQYNSNNNPTSIQSPSSNMTVNSYATGNNANLPTSITVDGITTAMSYDSNGNLLSITKNGINNTYTYNSFNDVLTHKDGNSNTTSYTYDGSGNLTKVQRPGSGGATNITRNSFGQVLTVSNPSNIQTSYGYNANGLVNQVTMPLNIKTSSVYDNASRLLSVTDANSKTTSYEYDPNDNVTQVTDANNQTVQHTYDANDNHLEIENQKSETQSNTYNFDDDLLASETFGPHTKTYTYNDDGSLATFTRGNGTFTYTYDASTGRLLNDGQTQYTYDTRGNIKTIVNTNGTLTLNYDNNDRMTSYSDYFGQTVSYGYDNNNNVTSIKYPGNKTVNYAYDPNNRCTTVTDWNGKTTSYTYLTDDRISQITLPNGTKTTYTYDAAGRPTGISNKKSSGAVISEYTFTLDNAGNHLSEILNEPSIAAGLQTIGNQTINYGNYPYNRISKQGSTSFTHNTAGAITGNGNTTYTYDLNDNLLTVSGGLTAQFKYDGAGNRREKTVNGTTTRYVLNILGMSQVLMENNSSNNVQHYYIYGPTGLLYRVKPNNTNQYYHYDFRGSTTAITNEAQTVTHSYSYDPFGKVLASTETDFNPYRYVGQHGVAFESDNLVFMRARYYDSSTGRFVSEDPIWALNLYPYADNNPVMMIDPKGEKSKTTSDLIAEKISVAKRMGELNESLKKMSLTELISIRNSIYLTSNKYLIDVHIKAKREENEKKMENLNKSLNKGPYYGGNYISPVTNNIPNVPKIPNTSQKPTTSQNGDLLETIFAPTKGIKIKLP